MTRVLTFHADWCGPCDQQEPIIEEIESEVNVDVEHYDVETEDGQKAANEWQVRSVPTTIVVDGDDYTVFTGLTQKDEILSEL